MLIGIIIISLLSVIADAAVISSPFNKLISNSTVFPHYPSHSTSFVIEGQLKKMFLIGDSITEAGQKVSDSGWAVLLAEHYVKAIDILNRGNSGYNTRWTRSLMYSNRGIVPIEKHQEKRDYIFATIMLGSNDCSTAEQNVPLPEYKENLLSIISYLRLHVNPHIIIILITPPPIDFSFQNFIQNLKDIRKYADVVREIYNQKLIEKEKTLLVDLWPPTADSKSTNKVGVINKAFNIKSDLSDGLHLSKSGNIKLYEAIKDVIYNNYPQYKAAHMQYAPHYRAFGKITNITEIKKVMEKYRPGRK